MGRILRWLAVWLVLSACVIGSVQGAIAGAGVNSALWWGTIQLAPDVIEPTATATAPTPTETPNPAFFTQLGPPDACYTCKDYGAGATAGKASKARKGKRHNYLKVETRHYTIGGQTYYYTYTVWVP